MKVVSAQEMARVEGLAYQAGASEDAFMMAAGRGLADQLMRCSAEEQWPLCATLLCGKGNNAGDAYVAGKLLLEEGYAVRAIQLFPSDSCSRLAQQHLAAFAAAGGEVIEQPASDRPLPLEGIVVDGLFGTGFRGAIQAPLSQVVEAVNASRLPVVSVDIPSGLNGDTGEVESCAIRATVTVGLGLPKLGYFLHQGWDHVGRLRMVDFGLDDAFISQAQSDLQLIDRVFGADLLPPVRPSRHKYEAGVVAGVAGSPGMPGAAQLASAAALRAGCGLVRLLHRKGMEAELSATRPEVIRCGLSVTEPLKWVEQVRASNAYFVGPGIGRDPSVAELLRVLFAESGKPCVVDADALSIAAEQHLQFPDDAILTPHQGELRRLLGESAYQPMSLPRLEQLRSYAHANGICLVAKGAPTFIISRDGDAAVCAAGTPGLATAGTGDVLTGVIAALRAQGLGAFDAACLGVYLHGTAGQLAAEMETPYSMTAGDVIDWLGSAFDFLIH